MLSNEKEGMTRLKVHARSQKEETTIDVEVAVSLAIHRENKSLAGEIAKGIFLPTMAKARPTLEELPPLVFLSLDQPAFPSTHH